MLLVDSENFDVEVKKRHRESSLTVMTGGDWRGGQGASKELEGGDLEADVEQQLEPTQVISPSLSPENYSHDFFDLKIASQRKVYLKAGVVSLVIILLQVFVIMPFYWGSLYKEFSLVPNLRTYVLSMDDGTIGNTISSSVLSSNKGHHVGGTGPSNSKPWLGWRSFPSRNDSWTTVEALSAASHVVSTEEAWAVLVIARAVTTQLVSTLSGTNSTPWIADEAVFLVYSQARNELAASSFIVPIVNGLLQQSTMDLRKMFLREYLTGENDVTTETLDLLAYPVGWSMINLHPYDISLATALTFVGLIYVMVFAFQTAIVTTNIQTIVGDYLHLKSLIFVRIGISFVYYFFISWAFALLGLAFRADFSRHFGGWGFILYWISIFLAISAIGLSLQSLVAILTLRFLPPFFILILLTNVSVCLLPFELLPSVYKYGYAWPAYNVNRAVRAILFGTRNELGLNFGVLLAWIALNLITLPLIQLYVRRKEEHRFRLHHVQEQEISSNLKIK